METASRLKASCKHSLFAGQFKDGIERSIGRESQILLFSEENSPFGSVGWLIDRTVAKGELVGSAWLVNDDVAVTSAHILIPFLDIVEALAFELPATGDRFGVREISVHSLFDPWMAKRSYSGSGLWPSCELVSWQHNVAACKLLPSLKPMNSDTPQRLGKAYVQSDSSREPDLTGQANRVQITTILQTLISARNLGTLCLRDARNRTVARFYMSDSKLTHIQYKNFYNEAALLKLLSTDEGDYNFFFFREIDPEWVNFAPAQQSTAVMLMNGYSAMEDTFKLFEELGGEKSVVVQTAPVLSVDNLPSEARVSVACVWNHIKYGIPLSRLLRSCTFDGRTLLMSVKHLVETGQATIAPSQPATAPGAAPLNFAEQCEARMGHEIFSISVDPAGKMGVLENGYVLGSVEGSDDNQFIHSIGLPREAIGSPIIMNQRVVGVHAGPLIEGFEPYKDWIHPGLFISSDAVYDCLGIKPRSAKAAFDIEPLAQDDSEPETERLPDAYPEGITEVDALSEMRGLARDEAFVDTKGLSTISGLFNSMKGMFQSVAVRGEGLEVSLLRQGLESERFEKVQMDTPLRVGDTVRLRVKALTPCYLAVIYVSANQLNHLLVYPETLPADAAIMKGASETIPDKMIAIKQPTGTRSFSGIPISASGDVDELLVLYSEYDFIPETIMGRRLEEVYPALSEHLEESDEMQFVRLVPENGQIKLACEKDEDRTFFAGRLKLQKSS